MGFPQGHSLICASTCPNVDGPQKGPQLAADGSLVHHGPSWAAEGQLPHHRLQHGMQGNLCSSDWSNSSLPSSLTLVSAVLFLPHVLIPVSHLLLHSSFFLLLTYIIPEGLSTSLMCSALASSRSVLELAGIGSAGTGKSSGSSSWKPPL